MRLICLLFACLALHAATLAISTGQTIDFLLTAKRDTAAAKRFLRNAIEASGNAMPRVMNVDKNPAIWLPSTR